ncbi:MAG: hypothetical protein H0X38_07570 [Planctomycetes bacterium]|nr:hypothetical protein [Planctomycetota bacterium]
MDDSESPGSAPHPAPAPVGATARSSGRLPFTGSAASTIAGVSDAAELETRLRALIRADLDSVSLIPTGVALGLLMASDPVRGFAVMCEAVAIWRMHGRSQAEIRDYLVTRLQVPAQMADYTWRSTMHVAAVCTRVVRGRLAEGAAVDLLCQDPGAERPVIAALVAMMLRSYRESGKDSLGGTGGSLLGAMVVLAGGVIGAWLGVWLGAGHGWFASALLGVIGLPAGMIGTVLLIALARTFKKLGL